MENRSHAFLAGVFTLLLGIAAVAAIWWFGGKREVTDEYLVVTQSNVSGLNVQAQVRYRGIRVGKVLSIDLDDDNPADTLIRISVKRGTPVTQGTTAKLGYQGVTGLAFILLEDSGKNKAPLALLDGEMPRIAMKDSLIEELTDVGGDVLRNARDFLANANQLIGPQNRQSINRTLANLEATSASAKETSEQLRVLLAPENVHLMRSLLQDTDKAVNQVGPLIGESRELVSSLKTVTQRVDATLGDSASGGVEALVPRLNDLTSEMVSNSRQLNRVLHMLEDSPQSLIFGPATPLPGPGEKGFVAPLGKAGTQGETK